MIWNAAWRCAVEMWCGAGFYPGLIGGSSGGLVIGWLFALFVLGCEDRFWEGRARDWQNKLRAMADEVEYLGGDSVAVLSRFHLDEAGNAVTEGIPALASPSV